MTFIGLDFMTHDFRTLDILTHNFDTLHYRTQSKFRGPFFKCGLPFTYVVSTVNNRNNGKLYSSVYYTVCTHCSNIK